MKSLASILAVACLVASASHGRADAPATEPAGHVAKLLPPDSVTLVPTSDVIPQEWRFVTAPPGADWEKPDFDDSKWKVGLGGLGHLDPPGSKVRSTWRTDDVWARRDFDLKSAAATHLWLRIHHDDAAEVYLNGLKVAQTRRFTTRYVFIRLPDEARKALKPGRNVLAVHCHHSGGGQYIDVGLMDAPTEPEE